MGRPRNTPAEQLESPIEAEVIPAENLNPEPESDEFASGSGTVEAEESEEESVNPDPETETEEITEGALKAEVEFDPYAEYVISVRFRDKGNFDKVYEVGDEADFEADRLAELIEKGLVSKVEPEVEE